MNILLIERKKRKLRQADMSILLGIGLSTYSMYESSKIMIPKEVAINIANIFGMTIEEIFLPKTFMIHE